MKSSVTMIHTIDQHSRSFGMLLTGWFHVFGCKHHRAPFFIELTALVTEAMLMTMCAASKVGTLPIFAEKKGMLLRNFAVLLTKSVRYFGFTEMKGLSARHWVSDEGAAWFFVHCVMLKEFEIPYIGTEVLQKGIDVKRCQVSSHPILFPNRRTTKHWGHLDCLALFGVGFRQRKLLGVENHCVCSPTLPRGTLLHNQSSMAFAKTFLYNLMPLCWGKTWLSLLERSNRSFLHSKKLCIHPFANWGYESVNRAIVADIYRGSDTWPGKTPEWSLGLDVCHLVDSRFAWAYSEMDRWYMLFLIYQRFLSDGSWSCSTNVAFLNRTERILTCFQDRAAASCFSQKVDAAFANLTFQQCTVADWKCTALCKGFQHFSALCPSPNWLPDVASTFHDASWRSALRLGPTRWGCVHRILCESGKSVRQPRQRRWEESPNPLLQLRSVAVTTAAAVLIMPCYGLARRRSGNSGKASLKTAVLLKESRSARTNAADSGVGFSKQTWWNICNSLHLCRLISQDLQARRTSPEAECNIQWNLALKLQKSKYEIKNILESYYIENNI